MNVDEVIEDWVLDYARKMAELKNIFFARSVKKATRLSQDRCFRSMSTRQGVGCSRQRRHKAEQAGQN
eukprot:4323799-Amphidinium_carterae.1